MLRLIFLTIILYILINDLLDVSVQDDQVQKLAEEKAKKMAEEYARKLIEENAIKAKASQEMVRVDRGVVPVNSVDNIPLLPFAKPEPQANDVQYAMGMTGVRNVPKSVQERQIAPPRQEVRPKEKFANTQKPKPQVWEFDKPNPWTRIVFNNANEYPYEFFIKLRIPSLNDFQSWKQVVPNLDFDPRSGELIIPSKDEPSALALANLIAINFGGMMSLDNILEKKLIQISVAKAKTHELVQTKLREQINETLYGKKTANVENNFEKDLAKNNKQIEKFDVKDIKDENFKDTFQHFSDNSNEQNNEPAGYDGSDYSFL
jgi:hypothetical protein